MGKPRYPAPETVDALRERAFSYLTTHFRDAMTQADVVWLTCLLTDVHVESAGEARRGTQRAGQEAAAPQPFGAPVRCRSCGGVP